MPPRIDLTGKRFGRLTVIRFRGLTHHHATWECKCDCGKTTTPYEMNLKRGETKSCGCFAKDIVRDRSRTHGMYRTKIHDNWIMMKQRCLNPNDSGFKNYGARGITVCKRWLEFENFYADMGEIPPGKSLGRIDNNKGYYPENCRWETALEQANNNRKSRRITFNNRTQTIAQWAHEYGMMVATFWRRLDKGWEIERAIKTPVGFSRYHGTK